MTDRRQLLDTAAHRQTASDASDDPWCSSSILPLPTTFTSDVWARLPISTWELMEEARSFLDPELQPGKSGGGSHPSRLRQACIFCSPTRGGLTEGNKISADDAIAIFQARGPYAGRHPTLSNDLAREHGITPKAVRDIWSLRSWWVVTRPLWSAADHEKFRARFPNMQVCARCQNEGAAKMAAGHRAFGGSCRVRGAGVRGAGADRTPA
jgi:hypothetical protein